MVLLAQVARGSLCCRQWVYISQHHPKPGIESAHGTRHAATTSQSVAVTDCKRASHLVQSNPYNSTAWRDTYSFQELITGNNNLMR